jgi:N-acetylmuramoyl-L-alanine amidase
VEIKSEPRPAVSVERPASPPPELTSWVSWVAWLSSKALGVVAIRDVGHDTVHSATTSNCWFGVVEGSRRAWWNGVEIWLGFEPRMEKGELLVNRLDLTKTFDPLLAQATLDPPEKGLIVLDPGHGGTQPGSRMISGSQLEKTLTLDWALRLKPLLEERGWKVALTRETDADVSLAERVDFAQARGAALFISLHFNSSFPHNEASGIETYCLTPTGMSSNIVREFEDDASRTYPNNDFDPANVRLAMRVHRSLIKATGATDRGVKRARFPDVLRWQSRPAILIEGGFLSNPEESRQVGRPAYRQKLAEAVAESLN